MSEGRETTAIEFHFDRDPEPGAFLMVKSKWSLSRPWPMWTWSTLSRFARVCRRLRLHRLARWFAVRGWGELDQQVMERVSREIAEEIDREIIESLRRS